MTLGAGVLLLAACGGGSDADDAVATPGAATDPPAVDAPLDTEAASEGDTGADASTESGPTESGSTDAAPIDPPVADAPPALQFTAPLVGGGEIDATTLAGQPTAFWFWSPT